LCLKYFGGDRLICYIARVTMGGKSCTIVFL
jgi:hypothetical protein